MGIQNIVVTGKSGAGKQPRIDVLLAEYSLKQLSTGNIFRQYLGAWSKVRDRVDRGVLLTDGTFAPDERIRAALQRPAREAGVDPEDARLGFLAGHYVEAGKFVPDAITNELFAAAFRAAGGKGLVLDGYPRTPDQSDFLLRLCRELGRRIDLVLLVDNDDEAIVARTIGRRICPKAGCGKVFHLEFKPPAPGGLCTACGTPVVLRSDDTEEKIRSRLREFAEKAEPALRRLTAAGIPLARVPGNLPVFTDAAVRESVLGVIQPLLAGGARPLS
jgi:adenylate kinase